MEGSVYVLTNPAMPNMVKIGKTTRDVELRLADLYSTGVPLPFECEYAAKVKDVDKTEKAFHTAFNYAGLNLNETPQELQKCTPEFQNFWEKECREHPTNQNCVIYCD